jgi:chitinase
VDYVNLMTYDFREAEWEPRPAITRTSTRTRTTAAHVRRPRRARVPGRGRAARASSCSAFPSTAAPGASRPPGDGLYQRGKAAAERIQTRYGDLADAGHAAGWVRRWDALAQAPFLWNAERRSSSATTTRVAARQVRYIREHGLAGAMFWEYSSDPTGALLGALYDGLRGGGATP